MKPTSLIRKTFRRYFLVGVIVLLPFVVTFKFFMFFIESLNSILEVQNGRFLYVIPSEFHPDFLLGVHIPGLGLIFTLVIILTVGMLSRNYFGRRLLRWGDNMMARIPLGRVIYKVVKQILQTFSSGQMSQFSKVVLVEFPRKGVHSIGFVTGTATGEVQEKTKETVINVFVPTTPNPTSGFLIMVPEDDVTLLEMSIEDAFKLIVSGGMVTPDNDH